MINKPSNNEVSESIKYSKKKQKEERKNENNKEKNDFKKRIEKIHEGEKLSPISKILKHNVDSGKRIRIYRNGDAFHKGINVRHFLSFYKLYAQFKDIFLKIIF